MALRVCVLASGSSGNCVFVGSDATNLLVDAGLSGRETEGRLQAVGLTTPRIAAVCLTHEHDDHRAALGVLHRRHGIPLYANTGTIESMERDPRFQGLKWTVFTTGVPFMVGDLAIEPFSVPHDAYDPVGFAVTCGAARVGIVTDMGVPTELIRQRLRNCQTLVIESNHDEQMLKDASRPWHLKQRILGRQGHLSNAQAAQLLIDVAGPQLRTVFLAHLSAQCNRGELALRTAGKALAGSGHGHVAVRLTFPDRVSDVATTE